MPRFSKDELDELRDAYVILPRKIVVAYGTAILLVLAAIGITSFVGFKDAVSQIAASTATERATTVASDIANSKAATIAQERASAIVSQVFESAISTAQSAAGETSRQVVATQVRDEARKAAQAAVQEALTKQTGTDVLGALKQAKDDAEGILAKIRAAEVFVSRETLAGIDLRLTELKAYVAAGPVLEIHGASSSGYPSIAKAGEFVKLQKTIKLKHAESGSTVLIAAAGIARVDQDSKGVLKSNDSDLQLYFEDQLGRRLGDAMYYDPKLGKDWVPFAFSGIARPLPDTVEVRLVCRDGSKKTAIQFHAVSLQVLEFPMRSQ